jgi:hypothetical protein
VNLAARNELKGLFAIADGEECGSVSALSGVHNDALPVFRKRTLGRVVCGERNVVTDFH